MERVVHIPLRKIKTHTFVARWPCGHRGSPPSSGQKPPDPEGNPIPFRGLGGGQEDTIRDIVGYCLLELAYLQEAQTAERILQALQGEGYPIDDDDIKISGTRGGGE